MFWTRWRSFEIEALYFSVTMDFSLPRVESDSSLRLKYCLSRSDYPSLWFCTYPFEAPCLEQSTCSCRMISMLYLRAALAVIAVVILWTFLWILNTVLLCFEIAKTAEIYIIINYAVKNVIIHQMFCAF